MEPVVKLFPTLGLLPFELCFFSVFYFIFFSQPPPVTNAYDTFTWACPMILPLLFTSIFNIARAFTLGSDPYQSHRSSNPSNRYAPLVPKPITYESLQTATLFTRASILSCCTQLLVIANLAWVGAHQILGNLEAYDPTQGGDDGRNRSLFHWIAFPILAMVLVGFLLGVGYAIWQFAASNIGYAGRVEKYEELQSE